MNSFRSFFIKAETAALVLLFAMTNLKAQDPTYLCELRNDVQVDASTFEFDVYLLRTGTTALEYASMQFGININAGARNNGTITVTLIPGTSELNAAQIPPANKFSFNNSVNCIIMTGTASPGAGNGTIISNTGSGTRVGRIRIENTVNFGAVRPDLTWSYSLATGYITKLNAYVGGLAKEITVQASQTTSNLTNNTLTSSAPLQYSVTGGGSYCEGGAGVAVGLSDSETGVTYTLIRGTTDLTPTVAGTGDPISFGNQTVAGTYTVEGTNAGGTTTMTGSAVVTVNPLPVPAGTITGTAAVCQGATAVAYTVPEITNATSYEWAYTGTGATISGTTRNITINFASNATAGNLTVRGLNSCGYGTVSPAYAITVSSEPAAAGTITGTASVCQSQSGVAYSVPAITGATSYTWAYTGTGATITGTTNAVTISFAANATSGNLTVRGVNSCGNGTISANYAITVNPVPAAAGTITGTASVCQGQNAVGYSVPAISGAASYTWAYTGTGATITGTTNAVTISFASNATSGNLTVRGVNSCGNGTISANYAITVTALPSTSVITGNATPVCGATGVAYSVTATAGSSYAWTVPTGSTITGGSGTNSITVTFGTTNGNITVTETNTGGCVGTTRTLAITLQGCGLDADFTGAPLTVCAGSPVTFTNTSTGTTGSTAYSWNFGAGATPSTANTTGPHSVTYSTSGTKTISLTITEGAVNTETKTDYITVNPLPGAAGTITGTAVVCQSQSGVAYSVPAISGATSYTWAYTGTGATITGTTNAVTISFAANATSGNLTVRGVNSCGNGTISANYSITVNPVPAAAGTITGTASVCQGQNAVAYSVPAISGAASYTWAYTGTGATITGTTNAVTISFAANATSGNLTVRGVNSCGNGAISANYAITVNALPSTSVITGNATPVCGATGIGYSVTATAGSSYAWTVPTGSTITAGSGTNSITVTFGTTNGNITVTETNTGGCVGTTRTLAITLQGCGINADFTGAPLTVCAGSPVTFTNTSTGTTGSTAYSWDFGAGATPSTANTAGPHNVTYSTAGTKTVSLTITEGAANTETKTNYITVSPLPGAAGTITGTASVCQGQSGVAYSVPVITGATSYSWAYTGTGATITGTTNAVTISFAANATSGNLTVSGVNSCGNGAISSNYAIAVNPLPPQPVITTDGTIMLCAGEDVVLTAPESASYLWSTGATTRSITVTTAGNYTVRVTNAGGCQSVVSATTVVTVNALPSRPTILPAGSVNICTGSSQTLTASAGVTWLWSNGETTQSISVNTTGSYTVQVTNSFGCLSTPSLATTVTVNPIPATPTITASGATTLCAGGSITLTSSLASGYLWSTGATTRNITVNSAGNYWVRVSDAAGCQSAQSAVTVVTVNPLPGAPTIGTITQPTCTLSTGSVILGGLPAGNWTVNPGGITGSASTVTVTGLVAGTHTFTVTNSGGCTSVASAPVVINTQPAVPTVPIVGAVTQPTCAVTTGSVGFSGLPSTGIWTLTRLPGGEERTGTGTTVTLTGIPSGSYTFTVTNAAGCTSAATGTVAINAPLPVPAAPVQTVDCTLGFNQAVITVSSPTGTGYEYRLDAGSFQTGTTFSNVSNGTHTITVRNSSGCTTTGTTFSVNCGCVNPPLVVLSAIAGNTCGTTAVTVSGNTFGGSATAVTITENGGGSVTPASSSASPFSFTYTPTAADAGRTVVITVTTNNPVGSPCAAASATYTLSVNANPVAPVPGTVTQPTCALPSGSVILNNLPAADEWTVTRSPGGTTTTGSGTSATITGLAPGTYTFIVTNALGCISPSSGNVVINAQPDTPGAPVIGTITQPTCALSTGSVAVSGLPASGTWTLTRMPGNVSFTGTGATRTVTGISSGTYTFTVANAAGCVSPASAEYVINIQPFTPPAPVIGTITHPTCGLATGSIVLENLPANGEWSLVRYPGGIISTGTGTSATVSSLAAGTYNFAVTNADGCTSPVSANAVINAQPATPNPPVVGTITHPTLTVPTGSVVLTGLPSSGTWTLLRNPDGFTSPGTGTTRTVSGLEPGTYTFNITNSLGCTSAQTGDVVINARPGAPVVVINNPPNICSDQTANLTLPAVTAGSGANLTFTYWTDAAATLPLAAPATVSAGTYYIMGTSTAGYSTTRPVVVIADELPVANAGPDQALNYLFGTTLNADIPAIGTGLWDLVSGTGEIFNSAAPSTQVNGLTIGDNVFSWTVTNGACYPVTDLVTVKVNNLIIPTLITPNQDGANDYFVLQGLQTLGRTELMIFDRRGLKVYENDNYDNLWDGVDYNSNPLPEDTYFYVVKAQNGASLSGYIVVRR